MFMTVLVSFDSYDSSKSSSSSCSSVVLNSYPLAFVNPKSYFGCYEGTEFLDETFSVFVFN